MERKTWKIYAIWIAVALSVGILAGVLSAKGTRLYVETVRKPPFSPPAIIFPFIWTALYILMGYGAARVYMANNRSCFGRGLNLYVTQLIVNFFWPLLFFNTQAFGFALLWLVLLWFFVLIMITAFWKVDRQAALLQIPYQIWLTFALYLNYAVWRINR